VLVELGSTLIFAIEVRAESSNIQTPSDAHWWTYVTIATVGYGDRYPVTNSGRVVGVMTMTVGVVLYGAITAFLADVFIRPPMSQGDRAGANHDDLMAELAAIRRDLRALRDERISRANPPNNDRQPESVATDTA
jgi:voltage-gated potassium channel